MTKDEFIKEVSIVDQEAGDKLDDIIHMASAFPKYSDQIDFGDGYSRTDKVHKALIRTFIWDKAAEGHDYWNKVYKKLRGTTDDD